MYVIRCMVQGVHCIAVSEKVLFDLVSYMLMLYLKQLLIVIKLLPVISHHGHFTTANSLAGSSTMLFFKYFFQYGIC